MNIKIFTVLLFLFLAILFPFFAHGEDGYDYNNYPMVTKIEQNIFNQTFEGEDIYQRLSRLERSLYKKSFDNEALSDRVDRLSAQANISDFPAFLVTDIERLERQNLSRTYPEETPEARLERIEYQLLGAAQSGDYEERVHRLQTISQKKSIDDYFASEPPSSYGSFPMSSSRSYDNDDYFDSYDEYNSGPSKGEIVRNTLLMLLPIVLGFL